MPEWTFRLQGEPAIKLEQARQAARQRGVVMSGDTNSGRFSGLGLSGTYERSGSSVRVVMMTKPFIVSWDTIENQLRQFLEA